MILFVYQDNKSPAIIIYYTTIAHHYFTEINLVCYSMDSFTRDNFNFPFIVLNLNKV